MKVKNCLGVACLLLALCVSLFLNGGVSRENPNLEMTLNESNISMALNGNQINTIFNSIQNGIQTMNTSHFAREVKYHNLTDYLIPEDSHFTIDGQEISDDMIVNYKSKLDIHLEWSLPNTVRWTTEDVFVYDLPEGFTFANVQNGSVMDNTGKSVGIYTISNNEVTIQYTDEDFISQSNIIGAINMSGEITDVAMGGSDGGIIELNIPGVTTIIQINVNPSSALRITKTNSKVDGENDIYEFNIVINSPTKNTNVILTDTMGEYLELEDDSFTVIKTDSNQNSEDITDQVKPDITDNDFNYSFDELNKGDKITITYRAKVLDGGFISGSGYNHTEGLKNTATVKSTELSNGISASSTVSTYKASVSKSGSYNLADNSVTWTIKVKPGQKGTTLKDVIDVTDQEIASNINVEPNDITIDAEALVNGVYFKPDSTGNTEYTITFKTKAKNAETTALKNKATIFVGEEVETSSESTVNLVPGISIDKSRSTVDDRNGVIAWNNKITIPYFDGASSDLVFTDTMSEGLKLVEDSIVIDPKLGYEIQNNDSTFTITFEAVKPGQVINIYYKTTFDNKVDKKTFTNKASVNFNGRTASDEDKYDYTKKTDYINKTVTTSTDDFSKKGVARWEISIDQFPNEDINNAYITDVVPEGMAYVDGSAQIVIGSETTSFDVKLDGNNLRFNLNDFISKLKENSAKIYYETKLTNIFSKSQTYTNNANLTMDGKSMGEANASITGAVDNLVSKDYDYSTSTAPIVNYTIKVNEGAIDVSPLSDDLLLEDKMGSALSFVRDSLKINGETPEPTQYELKDNTLYIHVPDNTALTITYQVLVNLRPDGEVNLDETNAFNTVKLNGYDYDSTSASTVITGEVLESVASSSSETATINIFKHREGADNVGLSGVNFDLYEVGFVLNDNVAVSNDEETLVKTVSTGDNGIASFTGLNYDRVYKIVESKTLDGYILNTTPYYFVFAGNDNIEYSEYWNGYKLNKYDAENFAEVNVSNEYSKINVNVQKTWNDDNYENRPDSITVYLKRNGEYVLDENGQRVSANLSEENNWTASFGEFDKYDGNNNRYKYEVEEDVPEHYQATYKNDFTIDDEKWTITNTLDDSTLTIQKVVGGNAGETDREFTFKVILTDKNGNPLEDEFFYTGSKEGIIKSGDTVKLKHGESITIEGLPYGTLYEVTELEANSDRYETTATNDKGKITFDENKAVFTNVKNEGKLTIDKTVGGNSGETDRYFNFKVILYDENGEVLAGEYKYIGSKTGTIKSGDIIKLKHGESITIIGLPVGASYEVVELEANSDGYQTTVTNDDGVIGLEGNVSSFMNYKDVFEKPYQKANIPQTGGSDNTSLYGILTIVFGMLSVYLLKRRNA